MTLLVLVDLIGASQRQIAPKSFNQRFLTFAKWRYLAQKYVRLVSICAVWRWGCADLRWALNFFNRRQSALERNLALSGAAWRCFAPGRAMRRLLPLGTILENAKFERKPAIKKSLFIQRKFALEQR